MQELKSLDTVLLDFVHEMRQRLADKDKIIAKLREELVNAQLAPETAKRRGGRKPKFDPNLEIAKTDGVDVAKFHAESEALDRGRLKRKYTRRVKPEAEPKAEVANEPAPTAFPQGEPTEAHAAN